MQVALQGLAGLKSEIEVADHKLDFILDPLNYFKHLCSTLLIIIAT